jgi:secreted trypsin-like serine protease
MRAAAVLLAGCVTTTATAQQAIVNGSADDADDAVVAIVERPVCSDAFTVSCSGTLLAPQVVLTAAHCVPPGDMPDVHVGAPVGTGQFIAVSAAIRHPSFDDTTHAYDLAILQLAEPASVSPLALPTATLDASFVGATARIVGFGVDAPGAIADGQRRQGTMQIASVGATTFDAMPSPSNTCGGDSGGPVFVVAGGGEQLLGVTVAGDATCSANAIDGRVDISVADFVKPYVDAPVPSGPPPMDPCMKPPSMSHGCSAGGASSAWLALLVMGCRSRRRARAGSTSESAWRGRGARARRHRAS